MVLVRSHDEFSGMMIQPETQWGVDPGNWNAAGIRVPLNSEELTLNQEPFPEQTEFGALGGITDVDLGGVDVTGSIVVDPRFEAKWYNMLLGQIFGAEDLVTDKWHDEAASTNGNTHIFNFTATPPIGLSAVAWKLGPTAGAGDGFIETITGLKVARAIFDQPEGDRMRLTVEFVGKGKSVLLNAGTETLAQLLGVQLIKPADHTRAASHFAVGATLNDLNFLGFTVTIDKRLEPSTAFTNDVTNKPEPGVVANRIVTLDVASQLEQDYHAEFKPSYEYKNKIKSQFVMVLAGENEVDTNQPYVFRLDCPAVRWTAAGDDFTAAGAPPTSATGRLLLGSAAALTSGYADHVTLPAAPATYDLRAMTCVKGTDDGDTKYSGLAGI